MFCSFTLCLTLKFFFNSSSQVLFHGTKHNFKKGDCSLDDGAYFFLVKDFFFEPSEASTFLISHFKPRRRKTNDSRFKVGLAVWTSPQSDIGARTLRPWLKAKALSPGSRKQKDSSQSQISSSWKAKFNYNHQNDLARNSYKGSIDWAPLARRWHHLSRL